MIYYNENNRFAVQWLRNLIGAGLLPYGEVDERSITEVTPGDLEGYTQHHFFCGIGIWPLALAKAGWPDDRPVWTGSCPCQPFSSAGLKRKEQDDRHLFPVWHKLIQSYLPPVIFGEQVAGPDGLDWFDTISTLLHEDNYASGALVASAASYGAPHIRDRQYFVFSRLAHAAGNVAPISQWPGTESFQARSCETYYQLSGRDPLSQVARWAESPSWWSSSDWLEGEDGLWRPVERGTFPLAYGHPGRVEQLRAYGNAIVLPQATIFVQAAMEALYENL